MPAFRRGLRSKRTSFALVAVLVAAVVAATASLALAQGPIYTFLAKANKPAHAAAGSKARKGSLSKASRVTKTRSGSKGHGGSTSPLPAPEPSPTSPTPTSPSESPSPAPPADTTAPETSISSGPALLTVSTSASFSFAAAEIGASFECKLDAAAWKPCDSPKSYSGLGLGLHTFSVRASDAAGNVDQSPALTTWTVLALTPPDTTAPETSISSGPSGTTTATSASFAFATSESGASFECKLDSGSWASCSSPKAYSGLAVGAHQFSVRATDAAGNTDASRQPATGRSKHPHRPPTRRRPRPRSPAAQRHHHRHRRELRLRGQREWLELRVQARQRRWASCGSPRSPMPA